MTPTTIPTEQPSSDEEREVALKFYQSARDEMLMRIRERELAMYVWLGALGTIMTVAFKDGSASNYKVLLLLPPLSIGIAMRTNQHEMLVAALAMYCKFEVGPLLKKGLNTRLRHWDESEALRRRQEWVVFLRNIVTFTLLVLPCLLALLVTYPEFEKQGFVFRSAWISGVVFTFTVALLELQSLLARINGLMKPPDTPED